ncbi:MAG: DUF1573 domain-containing protein [Bacteroidales bacterium]|nr:DUF1573 domain-containing protein [Bacteroidales bacterium]MDZ4205247.1 DUF1573 domain-containing protein [Bacteroidales bacterium]
MSDIRDFFFFLTLTGSMFILACGGPTDSADRLPADIIANPHTASGMNENTNLPELSFVKEVHDFGRLIEGEKVAFSFRFTNTGKGILLISNVSSSCGCTVPKFPSAPIQPGEQEVITVTFDSKGRRGQQTKTVTIISNTQPNTKHLTINANIVSPETID